MAHYMLQVAYTPESWADQIKKPGNRMDVVQGFAANLGGKIEGAWYCFGKYDLVAILEMPDNVSAAAFALAAASGGALKAVKTTPLMTIDEGIAAMKKAPAAGYKRPAQ